MVKDTWDKFSYWFQGILVVVSILIGLGILGWQVYGWLKTGSWTEMPLSRVFDYIGFDLTPVYYPGDWKGVAKVGRWFLAWPMTISIPIIASTIGLIIKAIIRDSFQD